MTKLCYRKKNARKKIVFDITVLGSGYYHVENRTGVYRVTENALKTFLNNPILDVYLTAFEGNDIECMGYLKEYFPDLRNKFFHTKNKLIYTILKKFDICFSSYFKIPSVYRNNPWCKKILIVHDLIQVMETGWVQESCREQYRDFLKKITKNTTVLCVSNHTKKDLIDYKTKADKKNVFTIPLGVDERYHSNYSEDAIKRIRDKYGIGDRKYFFSVSSMNPRKNFKHTVVGFLKFIEKYNIRDIVLVLAGPDGWGNIFEGVDLKKYKEQLILTGFVDEADLPLLYCEAVGSVYLSLYEGFGLPPLESIYCGTPPIASNTTSIPEVVGEAGILIDPNDENELISSYKVLYDGEFDMKRFREEAEKQKKKFNWSGFSNALMEFVR